MSHLKRIYNGIQELPISSIVSQGLSSRKRHKQTVFRCIFMDALLLYNTMAAWVQCGMLSREPVLQGQGSRRHSNSKYKSSSQVNNNKFVIIIHSNPCEIGAGRETQVWQYIMSWSKHPSVDTSSSSNQNYIW